MYSVEIEQVSNKNLHLIDGTLNGIGKLAELRGINQLELPQQVGNEPDCRYGILQIVRHDRKHILTSLHRLLCFTIEAGIFNG